VGKIDKKKILYIHQYFITPKQSGGTRSYWLSQELIKKGYNVTMLTARNNQETLIQRQCIDGINVIYIKNSYDNSFGITKRIFSFIRFMILSTIIALKEKKVDLVFATSTPLTVGVPALILHWFKRIQFVFEVRDLWPEVPIQMGGIKNKLVINILYQFEKIIYRKAKHIIALSPGMVDGVLKQGINSDKISMIPNMAKIDEFYIREPNVEIANKFEIDLNKFNITHFGAMGQANGLDYIINAAYILKTIGNSNFDFIFLGDGSTKNSLIQKSKELKLENIKFIDAQSMNIVSEIINLSDCSIVSFSNIPILRTNSPNKLFDTLSAGKPLIVNSSGWTKKMVEDNKCGAFVDPTKPEELILLLQFWKTKPELMEEMCKNSRNLAETKYDKSILTKKFVKTISKYV